MSKTSKITIPYKTEFEVEIKRNSLRFAAEDETAFYLTFRAFGDRWTKCEKFSNNELLQRSGHSINEELIEIATKALKATLDYYLARHPNKWYK